ncbi:hypothetical protein CY34DRAFT_807982 [Suillus luteus UH-Slu-Lm8-n1]|uniref:Unplaced genomic scaffold CY34scaffold_201, whole genome shotgun sequence n=1 Tax=Suillus luteus UH-Slu-Lm8-n1 TaxID=930992 RepID=A0A0D0AZE3_9AGAM|nr:hypothetical protein CY34DRAFT_807982 [Suillus luteus UH-Slu-Lm8-n1]
MSEPECELQALGTDIVAESQLPLALAVLRRFNLSRLRTPSDKTSTYTEGLTPTAPSGVLIEQHRSMTR